MRRVGCASFELNHGYSKPLTIQEYDPVGHLRIAVAVRVPVIFTVEYDYRIGVDTAQIYTAIPVFAIAGQTAIAMVFPDGYEELTDRHFS